MILMINKNHQQLYTIQTYQQKLCTPCTPGAVFGYDVDVMAGPESWNSDTVGKDYVERRKCYIYDWTSKKLPLELTELEYFVEMHNDFKLC